MNDLLERPLPGTIIGYLASGDPIILCAGASDDDDDDDVGIDLTGGADVEDDEERDDEQDPDTEDDGPEVDAKAKTEKPAGKTYTQADVNALLGARDKRLEDTRTQLRRLQARLAKAKVEKKPAEGADEAAAQAIEDAVTAERAKWQREIVHERAEKELIKAGLHIPEGDDGKRLKRLLRTIDYDKVEFEDGEIYGLDDQLDDLKNDYPELFRKPETEPADNKPRIRAPKGDAADKKNAPQKPKTTGELYAQRILAG
jgi:hypothetical protein